MTALALACALLLSSPAPLPEDPVKRVCAKALRGDFGKLEPFQEEGYRALAKGHRTMTAWRTRYDAGEGVQGRVDARGNRCTTRTLAANRLPLGTYVLLMDKPQLRQVLDRGARSNDRRFADRRGLDCWIDTWEPHSRLRNMGGPVTIAVTEG